MALGLSDKMVRHRVARARLRPLHRGIYAIGHLDVSDRGRWLAAVLAVGPGAALSHRSAAALLRIRSELGVRVDVTTARKRLSTNWIEIHGQRQLASDEVAIVDRIPTTSPARTLVDLAELVSSRDLARAVNEADVLGLLDIGAVETALRRIRGRRGPGAARLAAVLARHAGPTVLRSELEHRFRELLANHGLPPAGHNVRIGRWEVDACWPLARVAVELDGERFHRTPASRRRDAEKAHELATAGWAVHRLGWQDVTARASATAVLLRTLLANEQQSMDAPGGLPTTAAQLSSASRR